MQKFDSRNTYLYLSTLAGLLTLSTLAGLPTGRCIEKPPSTSIQEIKNKRIDIGR